MFGLRATIKTLELMHDDCSEVPHEIIKIRTYHETIPIRQAKTIPIPRNQGNSFAAMVKYPNAGK